MSAKNVKKFERGSLSSGSAENLSAKRPRSAKANRPSSVDGSKYSARSTASLVSFVFVSNHLQIKLNIKLIIVSVPINRKYCTCTFGVWESDIKLIKL